MAQIDTHNFTSLNKISTKNYTTEYQSLSPGLVFCQRKHFWQPNETELDVFGRCWSFAWVNFKDHQVVAQRLGQEVALNGPLAVFIPPYSIIDWKFEGGEIFWQAIISDLPLSSDLPKEALLIERPELQSMPQTMLEIKKFIRSHLESLEKIKYIEKIESPSGIAEKLRNFLNQNFEHEIHFSEIAKTLRIDHSVLDRSFKKAYGLSPTAFRNRMRILDAAHRLILKPTRVSDICFDVGFNTLGNFNKQFKKFMKAAPSDFLID
jgi:AraC-like DNA-binding protein